MIKRWWWLAAAAISMGILCVIAIMIAIMPSHSSVTLENGQQSNVGMTEVEVLRILGKPSMNRRTEAIKIWKKGDKKYLRVAFDVNTGRVRWVLWSEYEWDW
jgi:hypothetical protein